MRGGVFVLVDSFNHVVACVCNLVEKLVERHTGNGTKIDGVFRLNVVRAGVLTSKLGVWITNVVGNLGVRKELLDDSRTIVTRTKTT